MSQFKILIPNINTSKQSFLLVLFSIFLALSGLSQNEYEKFRALEGRVKYSDPDSLRIFSESIDSTQVQNAAIKYWSLGRAYFWKSEFPNAFKQLTKADSLIESLNRPKLKAELNLDLAAALSVVDQNGKALSYLLEANKIFSETGTDEQKTRAAISLAEMYRKLSEYDKAFKILYKIKPLAEKIPYNHARCYNRLAAIYSETNNLDSSLFYSKKALNIAREINEPDLMATSENEIGFVYRNQNKYEEALPHFFLADSLWRSAGMLRYAVNPMHHISVIYGSLFEIEKGLEITHKAYNLIEGKNWHQIEFNILKDMISLQDYLNRADSVNYYEIKKLQAIINWKDQQYEVNTRMVEILFAQKENEQTITQQEILLEKERFEKAAIDKARTNLIFLLSLIGLLLLIIFVYAYNQRRLKNKLFKENNEKEEKNKQLQEVVLANESLVQEISHRVKNNLAVLSGLLRMQSSRSGNKEVVIELQDSILRIESIASIHKKLYDKDTSAKVNLGEAVKDISENVLHAMGYGPKDHLTLDLEYFEVDIAQAITFCLVMNEVITNSCKYGELSEEKKLLIQLKNQNGEVQCIVKDQGAGFDFDGNEHRKGSLGLYLIKKLSKQLKATYKYQKTDKFFIFKLKFKIDEPA